MKFKYLMINILIILGNSYSLEFRDLVGEWRAIEANLYSDKPTINLFEITDSMYSEVRTDSTVKQYLKFRNQDEGQLNFGKILKLILNSDGTVIPPKKSWFDK